MSTPFSAGPQYLGYLYQARYALFALISDDRMDAAVAIERLEDVSVEGDNWTKLDQLKHHINGEYTINEYSVELWKTIRVWSESLNKGDWDPEKVSLNLITTAQAKDESAAAFLRKGEMRNTLKAYKLLMDAMDQSINVQLEPAFKAFKRLRPIQQERLIEAITIFDNSPNITDIIPRIKKELRYSATTENINALYERLEGWWFDKVVSHLKNGSQFPITQIDLREKVTSIADQFKKDSLPIDYSLAEPTEDYFTDADNRLFVRQLFHLKVNTKRVRNAVLDYYRAFEQRSRWARENLYIDDELINYEKRLKEEWNRYWAILEDEFEELANKWEDDNNCIKFGRKLLNEMESKDLPIRSRMPTGYEFVSRGSFHILADMNPPSIYWHPKFLEVINEILASK